MFIVSVFVAGLSIMAVEMTAFRLLAPSFGTTQLLITNVIGTIMVALSAGYWAGGRIGDRHPSPIGVSWILLGAAVLTGAIPFASKPILSWAGRALAQQHFGSFASSLAATVFLFVLPIFMLGMISPYAIRVSAATKETIGTTAGRIYSVATIGSIAGTYLPTFVFIPWLGTRATILIFSGLMLIVGAGGLICCARGRIASAAAAVLLACLAYPGLGPLKGGEETVAENESLYNYIHVVERSGRNLLFLNEGHGYHSVHDSRSVLVGGVWDTFLALPAMARPTGGKLDVLIVGLAGGTISNQFSHFWGNGLHVDGVEIDSEIIEAADKYFALDRRYLDVHIGDGRTFLAASDKKYDVIIVDAYKQPYIPFHLATREFFTQCREHLRPAGIVAINVATFTDNPEFLLMITDTLSSVFPHLYSYRVENADVAFKNVVVTASVSKPRLRGLSRAFPAGPAALLSSVERRLGPVPRRSHPRVLTDDWAPVEWYVDKTLFTFFGAESG